MQRTKTDKHLTILTPLSLTYNLSRRSLPSMPRVVHVSRRNLSQSFKISSKDKSTVATTHPHRKKRTNPKHNQTLFELIDSRTSIGDTLKSHQEYQLQARTFSSSCPAEILETRRWDLSNTWPSQKDLKNYRDQKTNAKQKKRYCKRSICGHPLVCLFLCPLAFILFAAAIAAMLIALIKIPTTATTTITIITTTVTTTTSTVTTTTTMTCASTCVNTTVSTASLIAFYSFDSVTTDATGNYPLTGIPLPSYVSGWVGSAISFNAASAQRLTTSNMPINSCSFSIDFWFYALNVSSGWDIPFMGQFHAYATDQCFFLSIYSTLAYIGFYNDDTIGSTPIAKDTWNHIAFVYDNSTPGRYIYLNGILDGQSPATGPLQATTGSFTIGDATIGGRVLTMDSYYTGYIDHVTISGRVKSACEIYLTANLACYFTFDSASSLFDSGPNFLTATNTGATSTIGRVNQALQFSSYLSYITVNGITALQSIYNIFTISMWVNPTTLSGGATLIHASNQSNGQGTCLTVWGLTSTGLVTVNVMDSSTNVISTTAPFALPINTWTHIAQTFTSTNGVRLYLDGVLVGTGNVVTGRVVGPYVMIGASPIGTSYCGYGSIDRGQFIGSVDEFRVFRDELTATDICRLANPT